MRTFQRLAFLSVAALLLTTAACGDDDGPNIECGAGTQAQGDVCVPLCGPEQTWDAAAGECVDIPEQCGDGTVFDETTQMCVPVCEEGTHADPTTGACVPDELGCVSGQVWDWEAEECVDVDSYCAAGTTWVASRSECVPNDELLTADQDEGTAENDPAFGDETSYEAVTLPAVGADITLGGNIAAPADKDDDGDLDADYDYWVFETTGPVLLRVKADGIGGASSGFMVVNVDDGAELLRAGIANTSDMAERDLFLPRAGVWALIATDAMNLLSDIPFGGPSFGYFITIENRAIPTATALPFSAGVATTTGTWPRALPATGSQLGFYAVPIPAVSFQAVDLSTTDTDIYPAFDLLDPANAFVLSGYNPASAIYAFETGGNYVLVADFAYSFGVTDTSYVVSVEDWGMGALPEPLTTTVEQPAYDPATDSHAPWKLYGFHADAGDVVSVHFTTGPGDVRILLTDYMDSGNAFGWTTSADGWIRFYAPYTGLYVFGALGLEDQNGSTGAIPAQSYDLTAEIYRQTPADVTGPYSVTGLSVTETEWEDFYLFDLTAGTTVWVEPTGADGFVPWMAIYDTTEQGPLYELDSFGEGFPIRSTGGDPMLLGITDDSGLYTGTYSLAVTALTIEDLGTVTEAAPIAAIDRGLAVGETRKFFTASIGAAGTATITISPDDVALDLALVLRSAELEQVLRVNAGGAGADETYTFEGAVAPFFFEVVTADGLPVAAAFTFDIDVTLDEFAVETEANNSMATADVFTPGDPLVATIDPMADVDWYAVTVDGPASLTATTSGFGDPEVGDTQLTIYGTDGTTVLAFSDDIDWYNWYSSASTMLPAAGTYYVAVAASVEWAPDATGGYRLDISVAGMGVLTLGTPVTGTIAVGGERDWYAFTLSDATNVVFETYDPGTYPDLYDSKIWIYASDGTTELGYDDDSGAGYYSQEILSLAAGSYYVVVGGYSSYETGDYGLSATVAP